MKEAQREEEDRTDGEESTEQEDDGSGNEDDLSPAAERVASDLVTKLKSRAKEKR